MSVTTLRPESPADLRAALRAVENELAVERQRHAVTQRELRQRTLELKQTRLIIASTLETLGAAGAGRLFQDGEG